MKEYELKCYDIMFKNRGYEQEGYESILPFNAWFALSKIQLHKDVVENKTYKLTLNFSKKTEEFFKFIEDVKAEKGFDKFRLLYDDARNEILEFRKEYNRRLTDEELEAMYVKYANNVVKKNITIYKKFSEKVVKRLAAEKLLQDKLDADYKVYLELKKRFDNEKVQVD